MDTVEIADTRFFHAGLPENVRAVDGTEDVPKRSCNWFHPSLIGYNTPLKKKRTGLTLDYFAPKGWGLEEKKTLEIFSQQLRKNLRKSLWRGLFKGPCQQEDSAGSPSQIAATAE